MVLERDHGSRIGCIALLLISSCACFETKFHRTHPASICTSRTIADLLRPASFSSDAGSNFRGGRKKRPFFLSLSGSKNSSKYRKYGMIPYDKEMNLDDDILSNGSRQEGNAKVTSSSNNSDGLGFSNDLKGININGNANANYVQDKSNGYCLGVSKHYFEQMEERSGKDYRWIMKPLTKPVSKVMIHDIERRSKCYKSDWTDGFKNLKKVIPAVLFLYFACLSPAIR